AQRLAAAVAVVRPVHPRLAEAPGGPPQGEGGGPGDGAVRDRSQRLLWAASVVSGADADRAGGHRNGGGHLAAGDPRAEGGAAAPRAGGWPAGTAHSPHTAHMTARTRQTTAQTIMNSGLRGVESSWEM